ncbi:MAG: hypothetical protein GY729_18375, partial [Desulfobacteraceae bacterium]|nr:hypothetical protein [Desulfobacteraceae bacterium]
MPVPFANGADKNVASLVISADMQLEYADALLDKKDYETAVVEFKRFNYFFPTDARIYISRYKIGVCLYQMGQFYDAAKIFNEVIARDKDDAMTVEAVFYQADAFVNLKNPGYAQVSLQNYLKLTTDQKIKDKIHYRLAKIHLMAAKNNEPDALKTAQTHLEKISEKNADEFEKHSLLRQVGKAQNAPQKSPELAGVLSIVPGGGYLYCGRHKDAFVSFFLNTAMMFAVYQAFENDNEALGVVIAFV